MVDKILERLKRIRKWYGGIKTKNKVITIIVIMCVYFVVDVNATNLSKPEEVSYLQFEEDLKLGKVDTVYYKPGNETMRYSLLNEDTKNMTLKERSEYKYEDDAYRMTKYPSYEDFRLDVLESGANVVVQDFSPQSIAVISGLISVMIPAAFLYMFYMIFRQVSKFDNKDRFEDLVQNSDVKFSNVIGHEEILEDIQFIVSMLKNPNLGEKTGARLPKGILFSGEPGTGKTLIAKAIAGEADVPFIYMNASSFIEMYVGLGAKRVRELFDTARKHTPCIIFIDEIDAVGGKRSTRGSHQENDQTLNALLQEMDGFSTQDGIFVIGATNVPDKLDKALKRAGRFDREIVINPPKDWKVRKELFEYYLHDKNISDDIDIDSLARQVVGFTGADIEAITNEASIIAAMNEKEYIDMDSLEESIDKHIFKGNRSKKKEKEHDREIVAYHESGHAVVSYILGVKIARASIIGTNTGVGGAVFNQESDNILMSNEDFRKKIMIYYGGRASESIKFTTVTVGAASDIEQATNMIQSYIQRYGFDDDFGLLDMNILKDNMLIDSDEMLGKMSKLSKELYKDTVDLLKKNYDLVEKLATKLLEMETLSADNIYEILEG